MYFMVFLSPSRQVPCHDLFFTHTIINLLLFYYQLYNYATKCELLTASQNKLQTNKISNLNVIRRYAFWATDKIVKQAIDKEI
jgi:hypothetical protein